MKLSAIVERRQTRPKTVFHGTHTLKDLYSILDNGLQAENASNYFGELSTALIYSLDWWNFGGRVPGDKLAYIVEATINLNDQKTHPDEDALAMGHDVPNEDSPPEVWEAYLNDHLIPQEKHEIFKDAILDAGNGDANDLDKLVKTIRYRERPGAGSYQHNMAIDRTIKTKGRSRIVAAYIFAPVKDGYRLEKIVYGNGSLQIGHIARPMMPGMS